MKYSRCPVCFLEQELDDFDICPRCKTQFGYDDCSVSHDKLRILWAIDQLQQPKSDEETE
jgi:hypothetical protein